MKYLSTGLIKAFCALLFAFVTVGNAQELMADEIASRAAERAKHYTDTFRNLLSEEKKTFEIYDKKGEVKKRRTVESTFLVYQLSKNDGTVAEFRNVTAVDGKRLANTDARAADFFEKVTSTSSSQAELDRIREESTRYDEDFAINGLTLFPAIALSDQLRAVFAFTLAGKAQLDGKEVYVLSYEQSRPHPSITINSRSELATHNYDIEIDNEDVELNPRIYGRLWIDVDTFNVRKEVRGRKIKPVGSESGWNVAQDIFVYTDSEHGILTPRRIEHMQYRVVLKDQKVIPDTKIVLEYGKFTRPDVEVKSSEIKGEKP